MSTKNKTSIGQEGIYDARQLGIPKMILLGMQHTFAMFGASVLVPIMTGLNVSTTLLMAVGARIRPMEMMIGPVTTGGNSYITDLTPQTEISTDIRT